MRWNSPGRQGPATRSCRCYWPRIPLVRAAHWPRQPSRHSPRLRLPWPRRLRGRPSVRSSRWSSLPLDQPIARRARSRARLAHSAPRPRTSSRAAQTVPEGSRAYGLGALRRELQRLSQASEGTRNHQLNTASFNMGRLVAAGALCEQEAAAALIEQGQRIGLGPTECERTVASGLSAGIELTFAGNIIETGTVSYRLAHARAQRASR
jgi:hypothetical protein